MKKTVLLLVASLLPFMSVYSYDIKTTEYDLEGDSIGYSLKPCDFHYEGSTVVELKKR